MVDLTDEERAAVEKLGQPSPSAVTIGGLTPEESDAVSRVGSVAWDRKALRNVGREKLSMLGKLGVDVARAIPDVVMAVPSVIRGIADIAPMAGKGAGLLAEKFGMGDGISKGAEEVAAFIDRHTPEAAKVEYLKKVLEQYGVIPEDYEAENPLDSLQKGVIKGLAMAPQFLIAPNVPKGIKGADTVRKVIEGAVPLESLAGSVTPIRAAAQALGEKTPWARVVSNELVGNTNRAGALLGGVGAGLGQEIGTYSSPDSALGPALSVAGGLAGGIGGLGAAGLQRMSNLRYGTKSQAGALALANEAVGQNLDKPARDAALRDIDAGEARRTDANFIAPEKTAIAEALLPSEIGTSPLAMVHQGLADTTSGLAKAREFKTAMRGDTALGSDEAAKLLNEELGAAQDVMRGDITSRADAANDALNRSQANRVLGANTAVRNLEAAKDALINNTIPIPEASRNLYNTLESGINLRQQVVGNALDAPTTTLNRYYHVGPVLDALEATRDTYRTSPIYRSQTAYADAANAIDAAINKISKLKEVTPADMAAIMQDFNDPLYAANRTERASFGDAKRAYIDALLRSQHPDLIAIPKNSALYGTDVAAARQALPLNTRPETAFANGLGADVVPGAQVLMGRGIQNIPEGMQALVRRNVAEDIKNGMEPAEALAKNMKKFESSAFQAANPSLAAETTARQAKPFDLFEPSANDVKSVQNLHDIASGAKQAATEGENYTAKRLSVIAEKLDQDLNLVGGAEGNNAPIEVMRKIIAGGDKAELSRVMSLAKASGREAVVQKSIVGAVRQTLADALESKTIPGGLQTTLTPYYAALRQAGADPRLAKNLERTVNSIIGYATKAGGSVDVAHLVASLRRDESPILRGLLGGRKGVAVKAVADMMGADYSGVNRVMADAMYDPKLAKFLFDYKGTNPEHLLHSLARVASTAPFYAKDKRNASYARGAAKDEFGELMQLRNAGGNAPDVIQ